MWTNSERNGRSRDILIAACALLVPLILVAVRLHHNANFELNLVRGEGELEADALEAIRFRQHVGPPSKFGFHHPGPLLAYILALPYALSGRSSVSLIIGCAAINLLSAAGMALCLARWGRSMAAFITLLLLTVTALHRFPSILTSDWPPLATWLPFGFYLFATAGFGSGRIGGLAWMVVAGSLVVQTNVLYAAPVGATAVVACLLFSRRTVWRRSTFAWIAAAGSIAATLWAPVLVGEIGENGGNLRRLIGAMSAPRDTYGPKWAVGEAVLSATHWTRHNLSRESVTWVDALASIVLAAALLWAVLRLWKRDAFSSVLGLMAGISGFSGILVLSRINRGEFEAHHGAWLSMAGLAAAVTIAASIGSVFGAFTSDTAGASSVLVSAPAWMSSVASSAILILYVATARLQLSRTSMENPEVGQMARITVERTGNGRTPHLEYASGYFSFAEGVALQLDKRNVNVSMYRGNSFWTSGRWQQPGANRSVVWIGPKARNQEGVITCFPVVQNPLLPHPVCISGFL